MARNLTEARAGGLSIIELSNREFKGGREVKKVFIEALKNFSKDFRLLEKSIFENNGNQVFYNFEIVDKNTNRLFEYDSNGLILHNSGHFCIVENQKQFVDGSVFKEGTIGTKYIKHNFKTSLRENSHFDGSNFISKIEHMATSNGLMYDEPISALPESKRKEFNYIINEFSNSLLNSLQSNFVENQEEKVNQFKDKVKEAVDYLLEYSGPNRAQVVEKTIHYLNEFPAIESINSCIEGVVFEYNGEMYKLTGHYGPINQLYGFYQKTLNEFDSGRMYPIEPNSYNVDGVLTHPQEKTIAVFPGSFKPPHAGHYRIVEELKNLKTPDGFHICNKIIILISAKARMAQSDSKTTYVTADTAKELWDLYVSNEDAQTRIEVRVADHDTPIKCIYDIMLKEMSPGETLLLVKSDKDTDSDRFNAFADFSNQYDLGVKVIQKGMNIFSAGISASNMRNWIADGDENRFKGFLPDHLSTTDRDRAWEIVNGGQDISMSEDDSFFLNPEISPQEKPVEVFEEESPPWQYLEEYSDYVNKVLENCSAGKTVIIWNSPHSNETDNYFLEAKLAGYENDIDVSNLYYANVNELFMSENGLLESEIEGEKSNQYAVVPSINTKSHWYLNNLKSENQLASRSLGQFHMLMENRIDFLLKTYRDKIFQKLLNQLTQLTAGELNHLGWTWASDLIFQSTIGPYQVSDPQAGKNLLSLLDELDPKGKETLADQAFEFFVETDPSQKKKYTQWLIFKLLKDDERIEDIWVVKGSLELFDEMKRRNIIRGTDINKLSLKDLKELVEQNRGNDKDHEYIIKNEMDILFQEGEYVMAIPRTERASCLLGSKTNWCTASHGERNMFNWYNEEGEMIVFITPDRKRQLHISSSQFMDENDEPDQLLFWLKEEPIFRKPFLKYLLDNDYDKKANKRDVYDRYFGGRSMMSDIDTFIFDETLTEEKALKMLRDGSVQKNNVASVTYSGSMSGNHMNRKLFNFLWNGELKKVQGSGGKGVNMLPTDKLKRRWVRKVAKAFESGGVDEGVPINKIRQDFLDYFINIMSSEDLKRFVIPIFYDEEKSLKRAFITEIASNSLRISADANQPIGTQNLLTLLEETIQKENDSNGAWDALKNSLDPKSWMIPILERPNLTKWVSEKWETLDEKKAFETAWQFIFRELDAKEWPDRNSKLARFFLPKVKEGLNDVKEENLFPSQGGQLSKWKKINEYDPQIVDLFVDAFINAIENGEDGRTKERMASWMLSNITTSQGVQQPDGRILVTTDYTYNNLGPPQFAKIIEPAKEWLDKND